MSDVPRGPVPGRTCSIFIGAKCVAKDVPIDCDVWTGERAKLVFDDGVGFYVAVASGVIDSVPVKRSRP